MADDLVASDRAHVWHPYAPVPDSSPLFAVAAARGVRLELTDEGRALAERLPPVFRSVLDELLDGFTPEEVGFLKSMLRRILSNYCETAGSSIT